MGSNAYNTINVFLRITKILSYYVYTVNPQLQLKRSKRIVCSCKFNPIMCEFVTLPRETMEVLVTTTF